jgi:poly(beta-D-mannuronate) lyase
MRHGLLSPWDMRQVAPRQVAYECGRPVQVDPTISILKANYQSGGTPASGDVKAAAYAESSAAVDQLASRVVHAADVYQQTGSVAAAQCVGMLLTAAADDHAMAGWMASRDVAYELAKGLRAMSIGYLKIRDSGATQPAQDDEIVAWMVDVAHKLRGYYEHPDCTGGVCDEYNRRALTGAFAIASVGIAANDRGMFRWSLGKYREAVQHIDGMGMLQEDCVGQWTLKFHLESVAALVQLAEYGELNGESMYAYDHNRVQAIIHTATRGLVDPTPFVNRVHKKQTIPKTIEGWEIGWATLYVRRYPDSVIEGLLRQSSDAGLDAWGGEPFGAEPGT